MRFPLRFSSSPFHELRRDHVSANLPHYPVPPQTRDARIAEALTHLKRDPTGQGFAHLGADGVARAFDAGLNVVDAVPVGSGAAAASFRREPSAEVRARLREVRWAAASPPPPVSPPRADDNGGLLARQEAPKACNAIFCNSDEHCVGQKIYGYDCSRCFFVSDAVGNCMQ